MGVDDVVGPLEYSVVVQFCPVLSFSALVGDPSIDIIGAFPDIHSPVSGTHFRPDVSCIFVHVLAFINYCVLDGCPDSSFHGFVHAASPNLNFCTGGVGEGGLWGADG